ncbi:fasciclin domain-containing protein [Chitinophaga lutea]
MKQILQWPLALLCLVLLTQSCKKEYYVDGGVANPNYNGTIYDYLTEKTMYFDTLRRVVEHAGLKDMLNSDTVTFFAPSDEVLRQVLNDVNGRRFAAREDSVEFEDIDASVWREYLGRYIIKGKRLAGSFPRVSTSNINAFPGINYIMLDGYILNIGLEYTNYNGVEAVGPRVLYLIDVAADPTNYDNVPKVRVVSSDIQPKNGVVHVLSYSHIFGFRRGDFLRSALDNLRANGK